MNKEIKENICSIIVFLLIMLNAVFWGTRKEGFHGDELYSYNFISVVDYPNINTDREGGQTFLYRWHDSSYFEDYLTISDDEAFDISGTCQSIIEDVHPPLYYIFLEIFNSIFFRGVFSKWGGIGLNLLFFLLTLFVLKKLSEKIFQSLWWALVICAFYGFSVGAVSTVVFIRMYMVLAFASICFCYANYSLWKGTEAGKTPVQTKLKTYGILLFSFVFGMLTQYYFLIFAFFTCAILWICLLVNRHWKIAIEYAFTMLFGLVCSFLIWPDIYNDMFNGYRGNEAFGELKNISSLKSSLKLFAGIINEELFGSHIGLWIGFAGILLFTFIVVQFIQITLCKNEHNDWEISVKRMHNELKSEVKITITADMVFLIAVFISTVMYILLIALISPYKKDRYIFNVYPIIALLSICLLKYITGLFSTSSTMRCITLAFVFAITLLGYMNKGVNHLNIGTQAQLDIIQQYSELPVITIMQENESFLPCTNSIYYRESDCVYFLKQDDEEKLPDVLAEKRADAYIFYIDNKIEDTEAELEKIIDSANMEADYEFIFMTNVSLVYLIHT